MTALEKLISEFTKIVLTRFGEEGEISAPVWMIETGSNERLLIMVPMDRDTNKNAIAAIIAELLKKHDASRYVMAHEMWFANETPETYKTSPPPSERPDRKEGVLIFGEDINGESQGVIHEIERRGNTVTLKPPETMKESFGRFTNLFGTRVEY